MTAYLARIPRRVVVTGIGVVSPIGCNTEDFWNSLVEGRSGVAWLRDAPAPIDSSVSAGEVREFTGKIDDFGELEPARKRAIRKALKVMARETQFAVAASQQALRESRLADANLDPDRIGVCLGSDNVSILPQDFAAGIENCTNESAEFLFEEWGVRGLPHIEPLWLLKCLPNMPACYVAIFNDFRGPNNSITQRDASANLAVAEAASLIAEGVADAFVTGGTGTTIQPFNRLHELLSQETASGGNDPARISRPFDRHRTGSVIAEGAAAFLLEDYELAVRRGATIYGEILGSGSSIAANVNRKPLAAKALSNSIQAALRQAGLTSNAIGHVHAHGLSTPISDREEFQSIRANFGDRATTVPVVAAKGHTGNAGAGSGAIELAASLLALQHDHLFPVLNFEETDPDCPVAAVRSRDCESGSAFLNLNISPEGQASCLAVGKAA